jgi:hypothetical protein
MAKELTGMNVTDNQSFQAIIHNLKYWSNLPRPRQADESTKLLHVSLAGLMTLVSFLAVRRWADRRFSDMFLIGNLTMIMFMASPVCHHHYFALAVPLVLTLVAVEMQNRSDLKFGISMSILVLIQMAMEILPKIPALEKLRDAGVTLESGVILWGWGVATCWQLKSATVTIGQQPIVEERLRTAA